MTASAAGVGRAHHDAVHLAAGHAARRGGAGDRNALADRGLAGGGAGHSFAGAFVVAHAAHPGAGRYCPDCGHRGGRGGRTCPGGG